MPLLPVASSLKARFVRKLEYDSHITSREGRIHGRFAGLSAPIATWHRQDFFVSVTDQLCRFLWNTQSLPPALARVVYKRLAKNGVAPDHPFTRDFFGIRYQGNLNNNIDFNIYFYGAFEKPLLFFLRDALAGLHTDHAVFVDVGANIGQHSLFMSRLTTRVHAFEPFAKVRERLLNQISHNQLTNITVHPLGLSNENARLPFFAPTGSNEGIGSFDASTTSKGNVSIGELELVRGDDYFPQAEIARIDILKMDVEGFEKFALQGLRETLLKTRPLLVCEITYGKELSFTSMEELLSHLPPDYRLFTFDKRKQDGSKARRRDARSRHSGEYRIIPFNALLPAGQDDVIACPLEAVDTLPLQSR
jgi:FkbM family methyltransferase